MGTLIVTPRVSDPVNAQASPRALAQSSMASSAHGDGVVGVPTMCSRGWRAGAAGPGALPLASPSRPVVCGGDGPATSSRGERCECGVLLDEHPPLPKPKPLESWHAQRHTGPAAQECLYGSAGWTGVGRVSEGERAMYAGARLTTEGRGRYA
jgi:hypothetical protein